MSQKLDLLCVAQVANARVHATTQALPVDLLAQEALQKRRYLMPPRH